MFTGIIEELGTVNGIDLLPDAANLTISGSIVLENTQIGDSIAVNGVCLTVVRLTDKSFTVDVMAETLQKTTLAKLTRGKKVNLERALQLQTRLGGHLVSGHVDDVGTISRITRQGIAQVIEIAVNQELIPYILPKGSIAIDGISLTVVESMAHSFTVSLIPHTFTHTTLGIKAPGDQVNLETDLIGKYISRFLAAGQPEQIRSKDQISWDFLAQHGFI